METNEVVELMSFNRIGEATIYSTLLESNGIRCQLIDEGTSGLFGGAIPIRLMVPGEQLDLARKILTAHFEKSSAK